MSLPKPIEDKIDEALSLIEAAIEKRVADDEDFKDLDRLKNELMQIRSGARREPSPELSRMVIDGMDWQQPYVQKYFEVSDLVSRHFGVRKK